MKSNPVKNRLRQDLQKSLGHAVVIAALASALGVLAMFVHPNAIPFVASEAYETMVPCPVPGGDVLEISSAKLKASQNVFVVDARNEADYATWHYKNAVLLTYDYLDPIPEDALKNLTTAIARTRAQKVVVYGDGGNPDTGELLGKDISGSGIKNVYFLKGGAASFQPLSKKEGAQ